MEVVPWDNLVEISKPLFPWATLTEYSKSSKFSLLGKLVRVGISSFSPQGSWSLRITRSKSYSMVFVFFIHFVYGWEEKFMKNIEFCTFGLKGGILISHLFLWKYFYCSVISCNCVELALHVICCTYLMLHKLVKIMRQ